LPRRTSDRGPAKQGQQPQDDDHERQGDEAHLRARSTTPSSCSFDGMRSPIVRYDRPPTSLDGDVRRCPSGRSYHARCPSPTTRWTSRSRRIFTMNRKFGGRRTFSSTSSRILPAGTVTDSSRSLAVFLRGQRDRPMPRWRRGRRSLTKWISPRCSSPPAATSAGIYVRSKKDGRLETATFHGRGRARRSLQGDGAARASPSCQPRRLRPSRRGSRRW